MTLQRRRGQPAKIYLSKESKNARLETIREPDLDNPIELRATFRPQRSARADVPGQQDINVVRMGYYTDTAGNVIRGVDIWGRVEWDGKFWDIVTPPGNDSGVIARQVRHFTADLRERPS